MEDQSIPLTCLKTSRISGVNTTEALLHTTLNLMSLLKVSRDGLGETLWQTRA